MAVPITYLSFHGFSKRFIEFLNVILETSVFEFSFEGFRKQKMLLTEKKFADQDLNIPPAWHQRNVWLLHVSTPLGVSDVQVTIFCDVAMEIHN